MRAFGADVIMTRPSTRSCAAWAVALKPDDVLFDRVELPEGTVDALWLSKALCRRQSRARHPRSASTLGGVDIYRIHKTMAARVTTAR